MNRETIENSRKDLEDRIRQYAISECMLFAALHPMSVDQVMADIRFSGQDVTHATVTVELDGKR